MKGFVLVIDDDLDIRGMLQDWLNAMGFDGVAARSGYHGLALLSALISIGCPIDGILLRLEMPRADGITMLEKLKEHFAGIPVIMMVSVPDAARMEAALQKGAQDVILRPIDRALLQEKCLRHFKPASS